MEAAAERIWDEFLRRWRPLQDLVISPLDGSALRVEPNALVDGSGNRFPVLDGVPALIPGLQKMIAEHYATSVAAGPPPDGVLDPDFQPGTITGYLLGRKLVLSELEPLALLQPERPGTVTLDGGALVIHCASGAYRAKTMTYGAWLTTGEIRDAESLATFLYAKPPFFLHRDTFPSTEMITLYEALPFFRWYPLDGTQPHDPGFLTPAFVPSAGSGGTNTASVRSAPTPEPVRQAPQFVYNVTFFTSLFRRYGLNVRDFGVLDIGGGDGFLGAAMEAAGADKPISTDIRRPMLPGFIGEYPTCPKVLLGFADMFSWCYAADAFSFIAVRNNSAVCFAAELNRPDLLQFLANCRRSLRQDGLLYLSVITGESSEIDGAGLANRPVAEYLAWFEHAGLRTLQMTRLGTEVAFVCCRTEAYDSFDARLKSQRRRDRERALRDYLAGGSEAGVLRNYFLAVNDFAGEIALAAYRAQATRIGFFGRGALSYHLWRALYVSDYRLYQKVQLIVSFPDGPPLSRLRLRFARLLQRFMRARRHWVRKVAIGETPGLLGERPLRVLVDDGIYAQPSGVSAKAPYVRNFDHLFVGKADSDSRVRKTEPNMPPSSDEWTFPLVSGDHDVVLAPSILEHYYSGRMHALSAPGQAQAEAHQVFEAALADFPVWYRGELPRN